MSDCPRIAIIAYGSILHPTVLRDLFHDMEGRVLPIKVNGFKRIFNQDASWRDVEDEQRAVLNVVRSEDSWFNGLLIVDLRRAEFKEFRDRERGYRLIEVEHDHIEPYEQDAVNTGHFGGGWPNIGEQDLTLVTTGKKLENHIEPIESYVERCLDGVRQWGDEFIRDFKSTTELNSGRDLTTHLTY